MGGSSAGNELTVHFDEGVYDQRIVHGSAPLKQYLKRRLFTQSPAVRSVGGQSVKAIDDSQNSGAYRDASSD
jgi:hypothetical protein